MEINLEKTRKTKVGVELHPSKGETFIPARIKLSLLSQKDQIFQEVISRNRDNYIQLNRFKGTPGEYFKIQIELQQVKVIENFVF